jgi:hypothetical protein
MPLFFWFFVSKKGPDEWRGLFLQDQDTTASYYPFSLCLSVVPSDAVSRTLVVFGVQLL